MNPRLSLILSAAAFGACDGSYATFLDSVPEPAQVSDSENIEVILAVDGLSHDAFERARAKGAFARTHHADFVTVFPGSSDYAWTRMLRSEPNVGYEIAYYDRGKNQVVNEGITGVVKHPFEGGIAGTMPCYQRFDFLGNGDTWMAATYLDPEGSLPGNLDELFSALAARSRQQRHFFGFILNLDVASHTLSLDSAVAMLMEIDRRIGEFKAAHGSRFVFTIFGDHGNTHREAAQMDPAEIVRAVGVEPVSSLGDGSILEAVPVVHVRVSYAALHTHPSQVAEVARRLSQDERTDLVIAKLGELGDAEPAGGRYVIHRREQAYAFSRTHTGTITVDEPWRWSALQVSLPETQGAPLVMTDAESLALTADGPYPDVFYRAATAFENPAARDKADIFISFADDVVSFGFHVPGLGDDGASKGFHGSLTRGATLSVVATEGRPLPAILRADNLLDLFPELGP